MSDIDIGAFLISVMDEQVEVDKEEKEMGK